MSKFCVKVVSIRSSHPYARGNQTSLSVKVIDQKPFDFEWLSHRTARSTPLFLEFILDDLSRFGALRSSTR